jgi:hypothetical protein
METTLRQVVPHPAACQVLTRLPRIISCLLMNSRCAILRFLPLIAVMMSMAVPAGKGQQQSSEADVIQGGSRWRNPANGSTFTILERRGETFRARFENPPTFIREVTGKVVGNQISWLGKHDRAILGTQGGDNFGTVRGTTIDFEFGAQGAQKHGGRFSLTRTAPGGDSPVAASSSPPYSIGGEAKGSMSSKIEELSRQAPLITDDLLGSLTKIAPASLHAYVAALREDLLDEAGKGAIAPPIAYSLGARLCESLLAADNERNAMTARLANNAPTFAAGDPVSKKVRPRWVDLERERDEAARSTHNNTIETPFAKDINIQWAARAGELHKSIDRLFAEFRAAARQPLRGQ